MIASNVENPPHLRTKPSRSAESSGAPHTTSRAYGILAVDDEEGVRDLLNTSLRRDGFAVWVAANGEEALGLYWHHGQDIDVVLMDVRTPGLDGPQTLAALQVLNPRIRCCFMSGDLGSYTEEGLRSLGAAAVLRKPCRLAEVAQVLGELSSKAALVQEA